MQNKKQILRIGFCAIMVIMIVLIISLQIRIQKLEEEKLSLEEHVEDYRLIVEEMKYDFDLPREDYIEKYARSVLGYHKYSEIIIKEETDVQP